MTIDFPSNSSPGLRWVASRHAALIASTARYLGALAVLAIGVVHIQQYYVDNYSQVPTIGTLFFLNFLSAVIIAIALIVPLGRLTGRYSNAVRALSALGGIGLAVLSLAALFLSESTGLFGFMENGYRTPITLAIVAEVAAAILLVVFLAAYALGVREIRANNAS